MKSIIFVILVLFGLPIASMAQQKPNEDPELQHKIAMAKAANETKRWEKELKLSEEQSTQLTSIFMERDHQMDAIERQYSSVEEKDAKLKARKAVKDQTENLMKNLFTPEQYQNYLSIKNGQRQNKGH
ncbi:MAG: hypothetical protein K2Q22_06705 [Cytophagales bacterium]|nr:hypothetical protein [Cytophagales bacterium]